MKISRIEKTGFFVFSLVFNAVYFFILALFFVKFIEVRDILTLLLILQFFYWIPLGIALFSEVKETSQVTHEERSSQDYAGERTK